LVGVDKSAVPVDLTDEQFVDLTGDPQAYRRLKEGLKRAGLDPTSFPFEPGRRPYPGFAYLEEDDAAVFFQIRKSGIGPATWLEGEARRIEAGALQPLL